MLCNFGCDRPTTDETPKRPRERYGCYEVDMSAWSRTQTTRRQRQLIYRKSQSPDWRYSVAVVRGVALLSPFKLRRRQRRGWLGQCRMPSEVDYDRHASFQRAIMILIRAVFNRQQSMLFIGVNDHRSELEAAMRTTSASFCRRCLIH